MSKVKSNSIVQFTPTHDGNILFKVLGAGERLFDRSKTSLEVRHAAELQGWATRIGNRAAIPRDLETGKSATPQEKFARMVQAIDHYESGTTDWRIGGSTTGGGDNAGLVFQAAMRVFECDVEACERRITKACAKREMTRDAYLKDLAKLPEIVRAIGDIKAERATANKAANAADILADMMADDEDGDDETPE